MKLRPLRRLHPADWPSMSALVLYRHPTLDVIAPALVTATMDTLSPDSVATDRDTLTSISHVHLTAFPPPRFEPYWQAYNVAYDPHGAPDTWHWPPPRLRR